MRRFFSRKENEMKKRISIEEHIAELERQKRRAEAMQEVIESIDCTLRAYSSPIIEKEGYYESYIADDGEEKERWIHTVYATDEDGNEIRTPPKEGDYYYEKFVALMSLREEILAIL